MPVLINEMTSRFDVRDEAKLRTLIAREVKAALKEERRRGGGSQEIDPSDAAASGRASEGG